MSDLDIIPYRPEFRDQVVGLSIAAWGPVFTKTKNEAPRFVCDAFYLKVWAARQTADVQALLDDKPEMVWLAYQRESVACFVGIRIHPEDQMGEIHISRYRRSDSEKALGVH